MDCSTPGFPVHHQLPEFTQTHVHQVGDAIKPSHPLSSPSPPLQYPFSEQAPGVGEGQGSLECCSPWGHKESDTTEQLIELRKEKNLKKNRYMYVCN